VSNFGSSPAAYCHRIPLEFAVDTLDGSRA
jgi:hypothetical protein